MVSDHGHLLLSWMINGATRSLPGIDGSFFFLRENLGSNERRIGWGMH